MTYLLAGMDGGRKQTRGTRRSYLVLGSLSQVDLAARRERFYRAFGKLHTRLLVRTKRPAGISPSGLAVPGTRNGGPELRTAHRVALGYMPDGDDFVVLASNFGQDRRRRRGRTSSLGRNPGCTLRPPESRYVPGSLSALNGKE